MSLVPDSSAVVRAEADWPGPIWPADTDSALHESEKGVVPPGDPAAPPPLPPGNPPQPAAPPAIPATPVMPPAPPEEPPRPAAPVIPPAPVEPPAPPAPVLTRPEMTSWSMSDASALLVVPYRICSVPPEKKRASGVGSVKLCLVQTQLPAKPLSPSDSQVPVLVSSTSKVQS